MARLLVTVSCLLASYAIAFSVGCTESDEGVVGEQVEHNNNSHQNAEEEYLPVRPLDTYTNESLKKQADTILYFRGSDYTQRAKLSLSTYESSDHDLIENIVEEISSLEYVSAVSGAEPDSKLLFVSQDGDIIAALEIIQGEIVYDYRSQGTYLGADRIVTTINAAISQSKMKLTVRSNDEIESILFGNNSQ